MKKVTAKEFTDAIKSHNGLTVEESSPKSFRDRSEYYLNGELVALLIVDYDALGCIWEVDFYLDGELA